MMLTMRVARPTDHLSALATMYAEGLGLTLLGRFSDHDGFDGVLLGDPTQSYHLEFTTKRGEHIGWAPTPEHLLVFYIPSRAEWETACARMTTAGFRSVQSYNAYWDIAGRTFEDIDRYRVVLQNAAWIADQ